MKWFSDLLRADFEDRAGAAGEIRAFRIADRRVEFRFADRRWIAPFTRSLEHLRAAREDGGLTIRVWDGETAPRNRVLRAYLFTLTNWWFQYTGPRGQLLDIHSENFAAFYDPLPGLLTVLDGDEGFIWKRDASDLPYFEACAPARVVLHAWLRKQNAQLIHGAAVGSAAGGVLLAGPGGSGKSTSALACLDSGLRYLSDDYCVVDDRFVAHSLYGAAKLVGDEDLGRFPELSVWNTNREPGEKAALFVHEQRAEKLIDRFALKAILVPQVTGARDTSLEPCTQSEALQALAPSTMAQLPASGAADLKFMSQMVRKLPCYRLRVGTELAQIPRAIETLLAPAGARA